MPHRARRCAWGSRKDFRLPDGQRVGEPGPGERPAAVGGPAGDAPVVGRERRCVQMTGLRQIGHGRTPSANRALTSGSLCPRYQRATMTGILPALHRRRKPRPTKNPRLARLRAPPERGCVSIARKTVPASPTDHLGRVYRCNPTSAAARVGPSPMINRVRASIRTRVGNKLGTVLATSAPCGHNAKTPRWRRASLGFADFKHHRNVFPMPRRWQKQTYRTQNPVLARGCGFKSHLR